MSGRTAENHEKPQPTWPVLDRHSNPDPSNMEEPYPGEDPGLGAPEAYTILRPLFKKMNKKLRIY